MITTLKNNMVELKEIASIQMGYPFRSRLVHDKKGNVIDFEGIDQEIIIYLVLDKDYRIEKYLRKSILPLLEKVLKKFKVMFYGCNLTNTSHFEVFEDVINKILGVGTKTFEEKVVSLLT